MKTLLCRFGLVIALVLAVVAPASAAVTISFYSHKFHYGVDGVTQYPHAFVLLSGTTGGGETVNTNLGFSAVTPSYALALLGPMQGALDDVPLRSGYVAEATFQFSFPLTDDQVQAVLAAAEKWRDAPQPFMMFGRETALRLSVISLSPQACPSRATTKTGSTRGPF